MSSRDPPDWTPVFDDLNAIVDHLAAVYRWFRAQRRPAVRVHVVLLPLPRRTPVAIQIPDDLHAEASVVFTDAMGDTGATPPGPVSWTISDPTLAVIEVAEDHTSARITPIVGQGSFRVSVDSGDLHAESDDLEITPGMATGEAVQINLEARPSA